jgi:hypothetical protein
MFNPWPVHRNSDSPERPGVGHEGCSRRGGSGSAAPTRSRATAQRNGSDLGRACRDAFLGLLLTCAKLGVPFWDYLGHRLGVPETTAPYLPDLVRLRSAHA